MSIKEEAKQRGITRLCHFTPSHKLLHILKGKRGILATAHLESKERDIFNPTDLKRLDGYKGHISCSIEYPNAWYFDNARSREVIFKDWVVLHIAPKYLWAKGTLFCPRNAGACYGANVDEGVKAFQGMYAPRVDGAQGYTFIRKAKHLNPSPTDDQAETLVSDSIACDDIIGIGVADESQAKRESVRLKLSGVKPSTVRWFVAPILFDKKTLSQSIRSGTRPVETQWIPP